MKSYRSAERLEGDSGEAQAQIQWAKDRLAARAHPVTLPRQTLERYPGRFQDQEIALRDGRLRYRRGVNPESPLTPMATDLFEVETDPTVRVRFVGGGAGPAAKIIGIYSDGTIDEWPRSR
jgi:hypothetical protein